MDDYNRGGHTKHSMKVHLILVSKYRKKLFRSAKRADDVKQFLFESAGNYVSQEAKADPAAYPHT